LLSFVVFESAIWRQKSIILSNWRRNLVAKKEYVQIAKISNSTYTNLLLIISRIALQWTYLNKYLFNLCRIIYRWAFSDTFEYKISRTRIFSSIFPSHGINENVNNLSTNNLNHTILSFSSSVFHFHKNIYLSWIVFW